MVIVLEGYFWGYADTPCGHHIRNYIDFYPNIGIVCVIVIADLLSIYRLRANRKVSVLPWRNFKETHPNGAFGLVAQSSGVANKVRSRIAIPSTNCLLQPFVSFAPAREENFSDFS